MSYYMTPSNVSLKTWNPLLIRSHSGVTDVPRQAPALPVTIGNQTIYSLSDVRPSITVSQRVERSVSIVNDVAVVNYTIADRDLDEIKAEMKLEVREKRKEAESSGISVAGLPVPTDDKTRDRVDQIVNAYADGDITGTVDFELPSGDFVELNAVQMQAIKAAGAQHIQACFSNQKALVQAINSAMDHGALAAIDITAGWPG
jgi:hypothetical protein